MSVEQNRSPPAGRGKITAGLGFAPRMLNQTVEDAGSTGFRGLLEMKPVSVRMGTAVIHPHNVTWGVHPCPGSKPCCLFLPAGAKPKPCSQRAIQTLC